MSVEVPHVAMGWVLLLLLLIVIGVGSWQIRRHLDPVARRWLSVSGAVLLLAMIALYHFTRQPAVAITTSTTSAPHPSSFAVPSLSTVQSLCVPKNTDLVLYNWNFVSPYLLCYNRDSHTSGVGLWQETERGFYLVKGAGGEFTADSLTRYGVPSSTANALVSGLHS